MIKATKRKVREVEFFLQLLCQEHKKLCRQDPETFLFYLSAFLSAARSITFALQSEEKKKYDAWFPAWLKSCTQDEQQILDFFKIQRNIEQKQGGAITEATLEYVPIIEVRAGTLGDPTYSFQWFGPLGTPLPAVARQVHLFDFGGAQTEVTELCQRYFYLLKQLVEAFAAVHK